ncbi:glycoside hydrolase family 3 N-terminal domain-containing protein [Pontiella sp.]|uniref:glycoside hydrolase family 3 N-terminal domain-containing protein n=1 Tax=Pontiella sp. TaxID=2837462 RepID=UPI003569122C
MGTKQNYIRWTAGAVLVWLAAASPAQEPYRNSELPIEERVEDLLNRMTLQEKVDQLRIFHASNKINLTDDHALRFSNEIRERLEAGVAGIKNPGADYSAVASAELNNRLQRYIIENTRLHIPALFVIEAYHGVNARDCTVFSRPISLASTWNTELVKAVWDTVGREARLRGLHMCHSPEADIVRDPRFGRMSEAYGEDTFLTSEMVLAAVTGVQGDYAGLSAGTHIGAVVKHFAGYGQVQGGRNFASIEISPRVLIDEIYPPYKAGIVRGRALGVMASHGDLNGVASHANEELLTGVLRDEWGFNGYVVSDANDINRLHIFMKVAETPEAAAVMALKAGMDIDLYSEDAYIHLPELVKEQPELEAYIDRAARRVLRTKFVLGLFENPYVDVSRVRTENRSAASLELALQADRESIILLKNENQTLPLQAKGQTRVALLGPLVTDGALQAFEQVAGDRFQVSAAEGFELTDRNRTAPKLVTPDEAVLEAQLELARDADVAVLYLGGDKYTSKEAYFLEGNHGDRDSIDPVAPQDELLRRVKALGKPVIVVLKHRRTLSINEIAKQADAILDCWELSEMGDRAVAQILMGEVSPSGKLPVTVPASIGQLPIHYSQKAINFRKGYLFTQNEPLYCFGHGLSYTTFEYREPVLSAAELSAGGSLTVSVDVTNTGKRAAKEVVQLYLKDVIGSVTRPDKELKGFQKLEFAPGETKTVSFEITPEMLAFTGRDMLTDAEPGEFVVFVGASSKDHQSAGFRFE